MKKRVVLVVLAVVLGVFFTAGLAVETKWYEKEIGSFSIGGKDYYGGKLDTVLCTFDVYIIGKKGDPEQKKIKVIINTRKGYMLGVKEEIEIEQRMILQQWESFMSQIKQVDEEIHEFYDTG